MTLLICTIMLLGGVSLGAIQKPRLKPVTSAELVGTWRGRAEKVKVNDGFIGILNRLILHLHSDGRATVDFDKTGMSPDQAAGFTPPLSRKDVRWRLKGKEVILYDRSNTRDRYSLILQADRSLRDPLNTGKNSVLVYRKLKPL